MNIILYIIIFIIGSLFGSFFTLAVYRIPLNQDITHKRSYCPNCNHRLSFLDLIPIVSYLCLGGKCRYCKQKIRPRYLCLEILSGIVFVLFAMSIKLNIFSFVENIPLIIYFCFSLLYFVTLFIIAGIDKEKHEIQKSVLLFGYIIEIVYIIYLYIVGADTNIYKYVIYLALIAIIEFLNIIILRKKAENNYTLEILGLVILLLAFTYEAVTILTINFTLLVIAFYLLIKKIVNRFNKKKKSSTKPEVIPIGFLLCITNIICFITANFYIFR